MPMLIEHIDAIARSLQRDVLYLAFTSHPFDFSREWDENPGHARQTIINWLDKHDISWKECAHVASEDGFCSYQGQIFVDVVFDVNDPTFKLLSSYLEDSHGNIKPEFSPAKFYYLSLEDAIKNAHHDEPGFWDKWAETF